MVPIVIFIDVMVENRFFRILPLASLLMAFFCLADVTFAQTYYNGTPPSFMTFTANYVKCRYGSYWDSCNDNNVNYHNSGNNNTPASYNTNPGNWTATTAGTHAGTATLGRLTQTGTNWSHRMMVRGTTWNSSLYNQSGIAANGTDYCMCYQTGSNSYARSPVLPVGGWDLEPGTPGDDIDTVIQLGGPVDQGTKSQSIEYYFIPDPKESVLMVMLAFATEKSNHQTYYNPFFSVEVMDSAHNLLDLGFYPDLSGVPMDQYPYYWPYSRFLYVPINPSNTSCNIPYCLATPVGYDYYGTNDENKAFEITDCPFAQYGNYIPESHSSLESEWFRYTQIAFNLSEPARRHQKVIFRVKAHACQASYHWAYGYFAAKMIPGYIDVDDCNNDEIVLTVPDGFSENSYIWYCGADSASAERTNYDGLHRVHISRANGNLYPYYRCEVKTQAGVPIIYECRINSVKRMMANFTYEQVHSDVANEQYTLQFTNTGIYEQYGVPLGSDTIYPGFRNVEWDFGDNSPRDTSLEPQHVYHEQGYFLVKLKVWDNEFRCCDSLSGLVHVDSVNHVSVQDFSTGSLTIYPNPATNQVTVSMKDGSQLQQVSLYSMDGRLLQTSKVGDDSVTLNVEDLPSGVYSVQVRTEKGIVAKRIFKL